MTSTNQLDASDILQYYPLEFGRMYDSIKIKGSSTLSLHRGKQSQASKRVPASNLGQHSGCGLCRSLCLVIEELLPFLDPFLVIVNTFLDGTVRVELASERKVKCGEW